MAISSTMTGASALGGPSSLVKAKTEALAAQCCGIAKKFSLNVGIGSSVGSGRRISRYASGVRALSQAEGAKEAEKAEGGIIQGGVVALGKFDALHIGHRALAEQTARMGSPVLLSFAGMAEVLGWPARLPVAAICDRRRIMSIWARRCDGVIPREYALEFCKVRSLSPEEFVQKLATELHVKGVVAGANYRFGYKAAGDASDLVHLCNEYGLQAFIVDPVMDRFEVDVMNDEVSGSSREKGQISSTRVRKALAKGNMERVANLLGRNHRVVLKLDDCRKERNILVIPVRNALNQPPGEGFYDCTLVTTDSCSDTAYTSSHQDVGNELIGTGQVKIGPANIEISIVDADVDEVLQRTRLGVEFPYG